MLPMLVTLDVSRLSGWLNLLAKKNMPIMSVTLDVSRLSGWLNASADCRVAREVVRSGVRCGRSVGVVVV